MQPLPTPNGPTLEGLDLPEARGLTINKLKCIAIALHHFASENGGNLPAYASRVGSRPLMSWRVAILPYLAESRLYTRFRLDEAWDSPTNLAILPEMPDVYGPVVGGGSDPHSTFYQAIVGPGTLFGDAQGTPLAGSTFVASPTLMVVEGARPVPWTKPKDVPYAPDTPPEIGGQFADGAYGCFADGSARFLSRSVAPETILALIAAGKDREVRFEHLGPWRRHPERAFL